MIGGEEGKVRRNEGRGCMENYGGKLWEMRGKILRRNRGNKKGKWIK